SSDLTAAGVLLNTDYNATILSSTAVPPGRLITIDPAGIIHGVVPTPDLYASEEPTIHMDTNPLQISSSGTIAAPTQSLWQTAQVALRMIITLAYAKRDPDAVQYI